MNTWNHETDLDKEIARQSIIDQARTAVAQKKAEDEAPTLAHLEGASVREQLATTYQEPTWRIKDLHIVSSFTTITAPKKTGKSTLMLNLMKSLLDGTPFLGQPVLPPEGNVGYLNLELDQNVWLKWVQEIQLHNNDRLIAEHLRGQRFYLWHPEQYKACVEWCRTSNIEVLIIDPGARLLRRWPSKSGTVENNNDVVAEVCQMLQELKREGGVTDLFVPLHTGHAGGNNRQHSRGAVMWEDDPDHLWSLWSERIVDEKIRHFAAEGRNVQFDTTLLAYDPKTHLYVLEANPDTILNLGRARAIVLALHKHGPLKAGELRSKSQGFGNSAFPEACEAALDKGWVRVEQVKSAHVYHLVDCPEVREIVAFHGGAEEV